VTEAVVSFGLSLSLSLSVGSGEYTRVVGVGSITSEDVFVVVLALVVGVCVFCIRV
jgi:hypothetical protein